MARKTNGSGVRSKKTVTPPSESVSPVPAAAQVSTELSANAPEPLATTPMAVMPAKATPVTATPALVGPAAAMPVAVTKTPVTQTVATQVAATQVSVTKTASNGNKPSVTSPNGAKQNLDEEIRRRAYELFLQRNGNGGDPNRDWLAAENEVKARHAVAGR
jgi:hypothetical protein